MMQNSEQNLNRFLLTGKWLLGFLALVLLLSGCSSGDSKQVIQIRVRSNRVEAQPLQNQFQKQALLPAPTATAQPTATPAAQRVALALPEATVPLPPPPTPAPAPLSIPIGRPDRIAIPAIGVDVSVQPVASHSNQIGNQWFENWQTASFAAGYHGSSALLGQAGNTVISGHNNIDGSVFQELYRLQPGEVVQLYANGFRYDYIVEDQFIVRERDVPLEQRLQNASWIQTTVDERVTLVSCWPPTGNEFRVIVVAKPLSQFAGSDSGNSN